ncbi:hypothetical protein Tco_0939470 [Tanacetum coccineum]|uniref:Reverse transcriptase domain-containing protein n=1 Tax=Tanacetum coccineum TaxID=301880 RepID=A0ABQ5DK58_9ASTR
MTCSTAITPDSPKTDSLIMVDKHLDIILETESDKFIKSSVENLVQNPSESEDECECDVPDGDYSQMTNSTTFSNPLFDSDDNYTSRDNESFSNEDVPKEIYSNPLFDEEIISSPKSDSLLEEFSGELSHINSIPPGIKEADFDPEEEIHQSKNVLYDNSDVSDAITESFSPSPIPVVDSDSLMEEIDLYLTLDDSMPPSIKNDDYDSEGDILFLEELLSNDSPSLPKNE